MPSDPTIHHSTNLTWMQLSLLNEEVVEIELRIGAVAENDHLQWQITARDPSAGTLLGMISSPATSASGWQREFDRMVAALREVMGNHIDPF